MNDRTKEFLDELENNRESFAKKDRSFDCIVCVERFTPADGQWIFYNLCDDCFVAFDRQKTVGRLWFFGDRTTPEPVQGKDYFESVHDWIASRSGKA